MLQKFISIDKLKNTECQGCISMTCKTDLFTKYSRCRWLYILATQNADYVKKSLFWNATSRINYPNQKLGNTNFAASVGQKIGFFSHKFARIRGRNSHWLRNCVPACVFVITARIFWIGTERPSPPSTQRLPHCVSLLRVFEFSKRTFCGYKRWSWQKSGVCYRYQVWAYQYFEVLWIITSKRDCESFTGAWSQLILQSFLAAI